MRATEIAFLLGVAALPFAQGEALAADPLPMRAESGGAHTQPRPEADGLTPEERMNRRFPQKVRVGDLLGLPLLDYDDRTLGHVKEAVRTSDGKIVLVSLCNDWFGYDGRLVGIPIETVAILARHLNVLDIPREDFPSLPTWKEGDGRQIPDDAIIRIAISRR
jgi:hypothetical protein